MIGVAVSNLVRHGEVGCLFSGPRRAFKAQ